MVSFGPKPKVALGCGQKLFFVDRDGPRLALSYDLGPSSQEEPHETGPAEYRYQWHPPPCGIGRSRPLVILIHGFPESWYSWRHQIPALAAAGYRVAAPDVRGYGGSDKPFAIEATRSRPYALISAV
jgi:pimeloyl-ACP methyl ester carboxylesterase